LTHETEKRLINFWIWLMAGFALLIILTKLQPIVCNAYSQPTAAPAAASLADPHPQALQQPKSFAIVPGPN
jgi:hypothetical protein